MENTPLRQAHKLFYLVSVLEALQYSYAEENTEASTAIGEAKESLKKAGKSWVSDIAQRIASDEVQAISGDDKHQLYKAIFQSLSTAIEALSNIPKNEHQQIIDDAVESIKAIKQNVTEYLENHQAALKPLLDNKQEAFTSLTMFEDVMVA